ncbi:hypothetical protein BV20DRAFT_968291, partial [Pilatotrama ljubarskyi]
MIHTCSVRTLMTVRCSCALSRQMGVYPPISSRPNGYALPPRQHGDSAGKLDRRNFRSQPSEGSERTRTQAVRVDRTISPTSLEGTEPFRDVEVVRAKFGCAASQSFSRGARLHSILLKHISGWMLARTGGLQRQKEEWTPSSCRLASTGSRNGGVYIDQHYLALRTHL